MSVLNRFDEIFQNPEQFSPENLRALLHEMLHCLGELKTQLQSKDESVRREALDVIVQIRSSLQEKSIALCQSVGMDQKTFEQYMSDASHFSTEEWTAMEQTKTELADFRQEVGEVLEPDVNKSSVTRKKPKSRKQWLIG